jgi:hypothetical protein
MENFGINQLLIIVGCVLAFAAACFVMPPLLKYGPRVIVSFFHRYVWVDFDTLMSRLADLADATDAHSGAFADATDAAIVARGHQHQVDNDRSTENALIEKPFELCQHPKEKVITMLAVQRKENGEYLWSSNEIKKFVPGSDGPIGEIIATVRGKKEAPAPTRSIRKNARGEWESVS